MTETLSLQDLAQFTGDLERYRHPLNSQVIYTPGIKYLADAGGAYWLIDAIASYYGSPEMLRAQASDIRLQEMQFWKLTVSGNSALLTAEADADVPPFIVQTIEFTDFPMPEVRIWAAFDGVAWTLHLPSEH